ncbi:hypothetical protein HYY70_03005 [Candidatus Woesearchaeota archaeon]|nr:hypothetical protein [Candidatus Woesearchaeota archaeon]
MNITIRDVNPRYWRELKVEAVKEGLTIGEAINIALEKWLHEYKNKEIKKRAKSFWDLKPFRYGGKDAGGLSTKIDEVLYGWKK